MEIYIHLPFCKSKCQYCDFNSFANKTKADINNYVNALIKEIELAGKQYSQSIIDTIFIGGGTPSMIDSKYISKILTAIKNNFEVKTQEITIECNPESITSEKLQTYKNVGINRISIGIQSLDNNNLRTIGRIHTAEQAIEKIKLSKQYFDNVSCDLIIGLPYDTKKIIKDEIQILAPLVSHISMYELSVEKGTPLEKRVKEKTLILPDDDEVVDLFDIAIKTAKQFKLERYEVSNFAKDGKISKHNFGYWTREEYLGFGAGAHSFVKTTNGEIALENQIRFSSPKDINAYIGGINCSENYDNIPRAEFDIIKKADIKDEEIMLGLRTTIGIDENLLKDNEVKDFEIYIIRKNGRISLNDRGMSVMNSILCNLI